MKVCWYKCLACCLFLVTVSGRGQRSEEWLPITQRDLQIKDVPGDPGAPALQLYYGHHYPALGTDLILNPLSTQPYFPLLLLFCIFYHCVFTQRRAEYQTVR